MKYKTFRNTVLGGALVVVVGGPLYLLYSGSAKINAEGESAMPEPEKAAAPEGTGSPAPTPAPTPADSAQRAPVTMALRELDRLVLKRAEEPAQGEKVKDAFPDKPYKVSLHYGVTSGQIERVKIDLNRNDKWDEKWSFEVKDGVRVIKRQVSPADDDVSYPEKFRLKDDRWVHE